MAFYLMGKDDAYPAVWYNSKVRHFKRVICPVNPGHMRGRRDRYQLSVEGKKNKIGDIISTVYSDWLITDQVAALFRSHHLTGYELRPIDVCNMTLPYRLWELFIIGKGGEAHKDAGMYMTYQCEYCNNTSYKAFTNGIGIIVDENNWDKSDFFTLNALPKFVLVTEKVKNVFKENKLKGANIIPSTAVTRNDKFSDEVWPY